MKYDIKYFMHNTKYFLKMGLKHANKKGILYFVFEPNRKHPGLADRLKAVISLYNVAKRDGLDFKLYYNDSLSLAEYLAPNMNWELKLDDLEYSLMDTRIINECNWRNIPPLKKNKQYHCYCYAGNDIPWQFADTGYKWTELFHELFKPSTKLIEAYQRLTIEGSEYISVHLRFVNALEHFENTFFENYIDSPEDRMKLIEKCKNGIRHIVNENPSCPVYVFSDSNVFLDSLGDIPVKVLEHKNIGHVSETINADSQLKTFLDLYVMSRSKTIYRIKANELYNNSCFALLAARIGDVKFIDKDLD